MTEDLSTDRRPHVWTGNQQDGWHCTDVDCSAMIPAAPDRPGDRDQQQAAEVRNGLSHWLFERDYRQRGLASPEDASWQEWVDRHQEQWREEADALLASAPITDALAAARAEEAARWRAKIEALAHEWSNSNAPARAVVEHLRAVLDGER